MMNPRIRELYNTVAGNDKLGFDSYLAEKFAELIVRECAGVALNHHLYGLPETSADVAIKTHFGVK